MSPIGIASTLFSLFKSTSTPSTESTATKESGITVTSDGNDFSSALALRLASMQAQSVNTLIGSAFNGGQSTSSVLGGTSSATGGSSATDLLSLIGGTSTGLSASGRKLSLFDPESGYRMMSVINKDDVDYKAQFSELSAMKTAVAGLQQAGETLDNTSVALDNTAIKTQLQSFTDQYNAWIKRFDGTVKPNGVLAGTQAAEVSLNELEYSVENVFNGAKDGFHGLRDLGVTIDETSNLASFDATKLDQALATNRQGAVNTIDDFAANFSKSAELLNSTNNFIPNRLANLDRAINYIDQNKVSLQQEFGLGAPAQPSDPVAQALAAYQQIFKS